MAFGFGGGGGGFSFGSAFKSVGGVRGALGGLALLGSALGQFAQGREEKRAAKAEEQRLRRERQATMIQQRREAQARREEADREAGALRANLAARGLSLSGGTPRHLINLLARKRKQDDTDAEELDALERAGLTSAIGAAGRTARTAGFMTGLRPAVSLLGGFAKL